MLYKSKVDIAYETIMQRISTGEYKSGDRLIISKIARENEISEIPVREAIRRLESEGYVTSKANQGAIVNILNDQDILEIFQIKGLLEGYAARLCVGHLKEEHFTRLREINAQFIEAQEHRDYADVAQYNMQFHLYMYGILPQKLLYNMITELWNKWRITTSVFSKVPARIEHSAREHEEIIQLLEKGDPEMVERAVRAHKFEAGYELAQRMRNDNP